MVLVAHCTFTKPSSRPGQRLSPSPQPPLSGFRATCHRIWTHVLRAGRKVELNCFRAAFCLSLDSFLAAFGASKVVVSLETSLKNAFSKQRVARTIPKGLLDGNYTSSDLQTAPERDPQNDHQSVCCALKLRKKLCFCMFLLFTVFISRSLLARSKFDDF